MRQKEIRQKNKSRKWFMIILVVLLTIAVATGVFLHFRHQRLKMAETTSKSPTAQSNYSGGAPRPTNVPSGGNQGGAQDNNGQAPVVAQPVPTTTSPSGVITINGLAANSSLQSGDTIYGTTTAIGPIYFRVIDDSNGVIAQGQLNVVNGSFSGKLAFTAYSATGRLDVYTTNGVGAEANNIEIAIQLK